MQPDDSSTMQFAKLESYFDLWSILLLFIFSFTNNQYVNFVQKFQTVLRKVQLIRSRIIIVNLPWIWLKKNKVFASLLYTFFPFSFLMVNRKWIRIVLFHRLMFFGLWLFNFFTFVMMAGYAKKTLFGTWKRVK